MEKKPNTTNNTLTYLGLVLIAISFTFYLLLKGQNASHTLFDGRGGGLFLVNFGIAFIYFIVVAGINNFRQNGWKLGKIDRRHFMCSMILFCFSAFTLNLSIPIFSVFVPWLEAYLLIMLLPLVILCINHPLKHKIRFFTYFLIGLGMSMSIYFSIYLLPYYPIGLIGFIVLGLSLHVFAPILLFITYIVQYRKENPTRKDHFFLASGIVIPILILGIFLVFLNITNKKIHEVRASIIMRPDNTLPEWVLLSQNLPGNVFTDKILKGKLYYDSPSMPSSFFDFWQISNNSLSEIRMHDPLVMVGFFFMDDINLSDEERLNILNYSEKNRHLTYRKLWAGGDLKTSNILTNIEVYPEYRLAYAEKYITINNKSTSQWSQEEALYTFYLPEGSVVTSMSLWINGKEEKSRLTTKEKADSAYVEIVGSERRDPALLHWQEGNRVTITVFPCIPKEERMLKIGFTIPLPVIDNKLVLENMWFDGPDFSGAEETSVIRFISEKPAEYVKPAGFKLQTGNSITYTGKYKPDWRLEIQAPAISKNTFSFMGKTYSVNEFKPEYESFKPDKIYLDVNNSWTKKEFDQAYQIWSDKSVFVFYDNLVQLTPQNKDELFEILNTLNFSIFPIYKIKYPESSLLISKSTEVSPNLSDLKESIFSLKTQQYLAETSGAIPFVNMGTGLSPYLKTLKEFGVFNYKDCELNELEQVKSTSKFPKSNTSYQKIMLSGANMEIKYDYKETISPVSAPDHLLRLFAYNQVLKMTGKNYFQSSPYVTNELIYTANEAYIVTPISSLVVLERMEDYDRFEIGENQNSLKNASMHSNGAAPEPHEWALIGIVIALILSVSYKKFIRKSRIERA